MSSPIRMIISKFRPGRSVWAVVLVALLSLALTGGSGCGFLGGEEEAEEQVTTKLKGEVQKKPPPAEAPAAEAAAPGPETPELTVEQLLAAKEAKEKEYVFDPTGRTDPFAPFAGLGQEGITEGEAEPSPPLTPLQKMELSQLKLVAVILAGPQTRALVQDSTGTGYIIEVGTYMGTRQGRVVAIHSNRVEVEEMYKTYLGQKKKRLSTLKLHPIEGEEK